MGDKLKALPAITAYYAWWYLSRWLKASSRRPISLTVVTPSTCASFIAPPPRARVRAFMGW